MTISKIWVFAQSADGAPTSATLELLTKARALGRRRRAFVGGDAGDSPRRSASTARRRCTPPATSADSCPASPSRRR